MIFLWWSESVRFRYDQSFPRSSWRVARLVVLVFLHHRHVSLDRLSINVSTVNYHLFQTLLFSVLCRSPSVPFLWLLPDDYSSRTPVLDSVYCRDVFLLRSTLARKRLIFFVPTSRHSFLICKRYPCVVIFFHYHCQNIESSFDSSAVSVTSFFPFSWMLLTYLSSG